MHRSREESYMKKLTAFVLTVLLLLQAVPFAALAEEPVTEAVPQATAAAADAAVVASGTAGDNVTWVLTDDGVITFSGSGEMNHYSDGSFLSPNNRPAPWWDYKDQITTVVINEGITSIGSHAFVGHSSLTSVSLPDGLETIWSMAFENTSLRSLVLPSGVTAIYGYAFSGCYMLETVQFPDTLTYIDEAAFRNCSRLKELCFPSSLTTLRPGAFVNCSGLTHVTIPASVRSIYSQVFNGCSSLTDICFGHDYDDELVFQTDDTRYPAFGGVSGLVTTVGVSDKNNINPAIAGYDWEASGRIVNWYSVKAPEITGQPQDASVEEKSAVTFSVTATGADLKYAWEYQESGSSSWTTVGTDGTSSSYTLKPTAQQDGWKYRCRVYNSWGSTTSDSAVLTVIPLPTEPVFKSQSLLLSGQIGLNFFLYLPEIPGVDYSSSYMEFTVGKNPNVQRADFDPSFTNSAGTRYGFTCYVTTVEAADTVTATFHYGSGKTVSKEYSVDRYIGYFEEHTDQFNEKTIYLIERLATHCYCCQWYLSYVNGWTMGVEHAEMEHSYGGIHDYNAILDAVEPLKFDKQLGTSKVTKASYKLHLDSTTTVDVFLTVPAGTALTATARFNGKTYSAEKLSDTRYMVRIPGFSAHQLGDMVTISGNAGGAFTVRVCPFSYARSVLARQDSSEIRAQYCMMVMYEFYEAVLAYRA